MNPFELGVLALFAAVSMWVVGLNLWMASKHGLVWTGIDGLFPVDQMQYLAWVQDASRHGLASDLFAAHPTAHVYLQPLIAISGGLVALGVPAWLALMIWKPVAVVAIFLAVRAYAGGLFAGRGERLAMLVLALFAAFYGAVGDEWLPFMSWGYLFGLIAVAALAGSLVSYDRCARRGEFSLLPGALGLLVAWLHPWQGEILLLIVLGVEVQRRVWPRSAVGASARLTLVTAIGTALPLAYYALLERSDWAWSVAGSVVQRQESLGRILLPLAPLILVGLPAYRGPARSFLSSATRLWPPAALAVWGLARLGWAAGPLHAWVGITVPLAALAVQGARALGLRRLPGWRYLAVAGVLALTIPGTVQLMSSASQSIMPATHNPNLIMHSEQRALTYLAHDPRPGAVLSAYYLGDAIPGETGRHTLGGDYRWAGPEYGHWERMSWRLTNGWLAAQKARQFVSSSHARFILSDCKSRADLTRTLGPLLLHVRRFGCATVWEIAG